MTFGTFTTCKEILFAVYMNLDKRLQDRISRLEEKNKSKKYQIPRD